MNTSWMTRSRITIASAALAVGCGAFAVVKLTGIISSDDTDSLPGFTVTLKNTGTIAFNDDELTYLTRIGFPQARNVAYAAVDYQSGPSRRFRKSLDDLQQAFGENLAVIILPDAASDQGREIHRILLALHQADPRVHAQVESRLLDERLKPTPSAVIDASARLLGADRFQAVYSFHKGKINDLMTTTEEMLKMKSGEKYGAFPSLFAADDALIGFDGNPVRLEAHVANSFGIRRLSDLPHRPVMQLFNDTINLGVIPAGSKVPVTLRFSNTGNEALSISLVKAGAGARIVSLPETPVAPGEEDRIDIAVTAPTPGTSLDRDILIGSNDGTGFRKLRLRGQVASSQISQTASR